MLLFQHAQSRDRSGKNRRLRDLGQTQLVLGSLEADLRELVARGLVGFLKSLAGDGIFFREVFAHADGLRTLAGKKQCDSIWYRS